MDKAPTRETPTTPLDRALEAAMAVSGAGRPLSREDIARAVGMTPGSGGANALVIAARLFGLLERSGNGFALTELGRKLVDDPEDRDLLVQAILHVRPYGHSLSDVAGGVLGLEDDVLASVIRGLDIPPAHTASAGSVLRRSIQFARNPVRSKATAPVKFVPKLPPAPSRVPIEAAAPYSNDLRAKPGLASHPAVATLLDIAPRLGQRWDETSQDDWLMALRGAIRFLYGATRRSDA